MVGAPDLDTIKHAVDWNGNKPNPSSFQPIDCKNAQMAHKEMSTKCDICHKQWKHSGHHGDFKVKAFAKFATQPWIVHSREFIKDNPGTLDTVTADLASGAHFESTTEHSDSKETSNQHCKRKPFSRKCKTFDTGSQDQIFCDSAKSTKTVPSPTKESHGCSVCSHFHQSVQQCLHVGSNRHLQNTITCSIEATSICATQQLLIVHHFESCQETRV